MKLEKLFFLIPLLSILFSMQCSTRYYQIKSENEKKSDTGSISHIHLGWIDLDEKRYGEYGYSSKDEWKKAIRDLNIDNLQYYTKSRIRNRLITGDASKNEPFPETGDIFIKFTNVVIGPYEDSMDLTIQFFDIKTKTQVYKVDMRLLRKSSWSEYTGYGRIVTMMDQIAYFISDKL